MREARNEKAFTLCKKRSAEGKVGKIPRKIVRSRTQNEERREKVGFTGQKTSAISRKIARNRVRNGEKREKRRFWSEKGGVGERRKKWALLPILQCYEVTKWVQTKFSRIFFR